MKEIYLIRHGETDLNRLGIVQGRGVNSSLNATGIWQAAQFYDHYKEVKFDHIYISSLVRTQETVQGFINQGIPYTKLADLDELAWGEWEGKPVSEASKAAFKDIALRWQEGEYTAKFEGGESPQEVLTRLKSAMNLILSDTSSKTILICMHGRAMRLLLCYLMGEELNHMVNYPHQNTTLYKLIYDGSTFRIALFNSTEHLVSS